MSISKTLARAAQLQQKIDQLRGELTSLLDKARSEIAQDGADETPTKVRRGRGKALKSNRTGSAVALTAVAPARAPRARASRPVRRGKRSSLAGQQRAASPTGPLAPAVVKVLQTKKQPMSVRDILAGLTANGYQFSSPQPRKNLAARIYRLKGVKQVSAGLFGLA